MYNVWVANGWLEHDGGFTYQYSTAGGGIEMVEVHALQFYEKHRHNLDAFMSENGMTFCNSVRVPLLMFGQDEAIFKQNLMNIMEWQGRNGEMPTKPKDEGQGLMASGITGRELGYGYKPTPEELVKINDFRRMYRPHYADAEAATKVYGTSKKKDITVEDWDNSYLFEYGGADGSYWTYDRSVLQLENLADIVDALFSIPWDGVESPHNCFVESEAHPNKLVRQYECLFNTDHSCGHDRGRRDGLDVTSQRKGPSSAAKKMRDVEITDEAGVLSDEFDHPLKLKVGMIQKLVFGDTDNFGNPEIGPFWWSPDDRARYKFDDIDGIQTVPLLKKELQKALEATGIDPSGKKDELVRKCTNHVPPIPITKQVQKVRREGWYGKPKGLFQILYERGYIDQTKVSMYTLNGPKDEDNVVMKAFSLNALIRKCPDFVNEPTMMQYIAKEKLGIIVDRSPKCSPELAGEGIEYVWACSKGWYRAQALSRKKNKASFHKLVNECLGSDVITIERARMFSRRAREYMVAYHKLAGDDKSATPALLSQAIKVRKHHTEVTDISFAWISDVMKDIAIEMKKKKKGRG